MNYQDEPEAHGVGFDIGYGYGRPALSWTTASKPETYPEDKGQRLAFIEGYEYGVWYRAQESSALNAVRDGSPYNGMRSLRRGQ